MKPSLQSIQRIHNCDPILAKPRGHRRAFAFAEVFEIQVAHESRRVDNQLRGRSGRQGDPGSSRFYLSLEDDLMRLFLQGNLASKLMEGSMQEGEELEHPWLNRSIESAQKKVEQQNYSIRKRLLQYDDVLNQQREVVYGVRNAAIHAERPKDIIFEQIEEELHHRLEVAGFGEKVYVYDDHSVTATAGSSACAGYFVGLDSATQSQAMVITILGGFGAKT